MEKIGEIIRQIREKKKLSLRSLGEASGVPWNTIARIERGEHDSPKWQSLVAIFDALGLELVPKRAG